MLTGDTAAARGFIEEALRVADQYGLNLPRQYLLSTRGEIELADANWDAAEEWIAASLAEARLHNNVAHMAKCRATLSQAARGRGDLDAALILLDEAAELAAPLAARFLQAQIDLWLTELYLDRGEIIAAAEVLKRGEDRLAGSHYRRLIERSQTLRRRLPTATDEGEHR